MRPLAGIACRPSVRRTMPAASMPCATARRARASAKAPWLTLKDTKYVTRLGLSRYVARKRGSWRRASASAGRRSDAIEKRPARNSLRISSGGTPNRKTMPSFFGIALAPVGGVPLELEPLARLEARDAVRPRPDAALPPALSDRAGALGHDARARPRHEDGEERQRLLELDDELRRGDDVEALEVRGLAVDEALGAADRGEEEAAARPLLEEALEGVADVAGGERPGRRGSARPAAGGSGSARRRPRESPPRRATGRRGRPRRPA